MLTSAFILIIAFASADMVYTISVCKKDHILHFFNKDCALKQTKDITSCFFSLCLMHCFLNISAYEA